ncbi:CYTH and CHAD domain-containing protein [Micrococcus sp.]|uniref:CYTH and CHAD domain-containing protein n=1 Tax=Micrococcus sp. TaxID=1271 RepID=UPI002A920E59|nr:CYTH and CHAD domain-containing protein [Micrococcus sp.]MDY6055259.1 CYTH and CHAD domain-containing protein [Micrococcus sp.]
MAADRPRTAHPDDLPEGVSAAVETEATFEIAEGDSLPDLSSLADLGQRREHRLRAVYFDTTDLTLIRARVTLRRREGGDDAGWHLKLPSGADRLEVHAEPVTGPGTWRVPDALREALAGHLGQEWTDRPASARGLVPAAVITTRRTETDLLNAEGTAVAVLCDDVVQAEPSGRRWRELEIELLPGTDPSLLARAVDLLAEQGVHTARMPSKLGRALQDEVRRVERGKGPRRKGPAARVVMAHAAAQLAVLTGREEEVRSDAPDAVHKTRVATRRLRSTLRTFRPLLDREVTDPLRDELRWYAGVLGGPRDAEVVRERVIAEIDAVPRQDYEGPVKRSSTAELNRRHREAHAALVTAMDGRRYAELMDRLVEFVASPPLRSRAGRPAREVLPALVEKAERRARCRHRAADRAEGAERMELLHETRKAAKAVRYAHEALAPAFGQDAEHRAGLWEQVTETLGQVQDLEVTLETLRRLRSTAGRKGEPTYTYGWLVGRLTAQQGPAVAEGEAALAEAMQAALARR